MENSELNRSCASLLADIAQASERMNAFARRLQQNPIFVSVIAGTDIRHYQDGWKVEKHVEAKLKNEEGQFAVWWLELSFDGSRWKIDANNDIANGTYYHEFPSRFAATFSEVGRQLEFAIEDLENSFAVGADFRRAIEQLSADG